MKYILGSGLIAFLAKILMPDYEIIPVGKSRYYKFPVATCDDYIVCHKDIDDFIGDIAKKTSLNQAIPVFFKRALSYSGQIIFGKNEGFLNNWIYKIYGNGSNPNSNNLIKLDSFVYNISCTDVFKVAENHSKKFFREFVECGDKFKSIDTKNRIIYTNKNCFEYEHIINTIPLDALYKYCGFDDEFDYKDLHTFVVETDDLDFEGASELLVVDQEINFFKCTRVGRKTYQFFGTSEIIDLSRYLSMFMSRFDILSATVVRKAIPIGDHNKHRETEQHEITCVGSNAQWDDMMDVSSCIKRLIRIANK